MTTIEERLARLRTRRLGEDRLAWIYKEAKELITNIRKAFDGSRQL